MAYKNMKKQKLHVATLHRTQKLRNLSAMKSTKPIIKVDKIKVNYFGRVIGNLFNKIF